MGFSDVQAATIPMNGLTARLALDTLALPAGATVAVTGAAGTVGGYFVQLAKQAGLVVVADLLTRPTRHAPVSPQRVRPGLHLMLQTLHDVPAFILGRRTDVLAANRLAREVLTDFEALAVPQRNLARYYLLDPEAKTRTGDWERIAAETVAMLRLEAGRHPQDRRLADLVGELRLRSPEFGSWWNDHRVLRRTHGTKHYHHPLVGELHFHYESLQPPGDPDQTLCVYNVEPGSPTAQALRLLSSWVAPIAAP
ncbi:hypothetical protein ACIA8R_45020 [Nonomuraea sp. NPDC051191]|uniref:MmyB family transcriptional regulator n=1 Tax=Nonomuraea sp. NPDC051191 TaxID=3364372 RepID=UPI0037B2A32D